MNAPGEAAIGSSWSLPVVARRVLKPRPLLFVLLVALTFFAAHSCQRSQVRISQERAISIAQSRVDFRPERTQIRLVREGLTSRPYWAVSLSIPAKGGYKELTVVRVDANSGKVAALTDERANQSP
jgi:hypothetical protein